MQPYTVYALAILFKAHQSPVRLEANVVHRVRIRGWSFWDGERVTIIIKDPVGWTFVIDATGVGIHMLDEVLPVVGEVMAEARNNERAVAISVAFNHTPGYSERNIEMDSVEEIMTLKGCAGITFPVLHEQSRIRHSLQVGAKMRTAANSHLPAREFIPTPLLTTLRFS